MQCREVSKKAFNIEKAQEAHVSWKHMEAQKTWETQETQEAQKVQASPTKG